MALSQQAIQARINYSAHLKAVMTELAVTQTELAEAIGKDQKTVSRYISGESYPAGCIARIEEYLLSRCCFKNDEFMHIPSEEFDWLFSSIYDLLYANGINEAAFARKTGISQKDLNNYHNSIIRKGSSVKLSAELQYKIVSAFIGLGNALFKDAPGYFSVSYELSLYTFPDNVSSVRESITTLV